MTRVRFAPSPTGYLHVGNARAAIVNWLYAYKTKGEFILRLDDTDPERSREEFAEQIQRDLAWLQITPSFTVRQSDRFPLYNQAVESLKQQGRLYPCYETAEELELKRKRQLSRGQPPIYDRAALNLTAAEREQKEAAGAKPHWRFHLNDAPIEWQDLVRGKITFHGSRLSDPILIKSDGLPVYTLASVVDDMDLHITHIIRGEDHVTNSAVQVQLFEALGADTSKIHLGHFPLLIDASGQGFSKREGSLSLMRLKEEGIDPMTLFSLIATLGTSEEIHPEWDIEKLASDFELTNFSRSAPKFDHSELVKLNQSLLHKLPFSEALKRLSQSFTPPLTESFWNAICGNIETLQDIPAWHTRIYQDITLAFMPEASVVETALQTFPDTTLWDETTWQTWTQTIRTQTGINGKSLYLPLRQALTGLDHGPEMRLLLPLIGKEKCKARLKAAVTEQ